MDFLEIARSRQSTRKYDASRPVEDAKLEKILEAGILAPSACNGQPYFITVCRGETAEKVAKATQGMGLNRFATDAPVLLVISEKPYVKSAAIGSKIKDNDYRSLDIGILAAYLTAEAETEGLSTCILGWLDDEKIREACDLDGKVRLVITLGYAPEGYALREKTRKEKKELIAYKD